MAHQMLGFVSKTLPVTRHCLRHVCWRRSGLEYDKYSSAIASRPTRRLKHVTRSVVLRQGLGSDLRAYARFWPAMHGPSACIYAWSFRRIGPV